MSTNTQTLKINIDENDETTGSVSGTQVSLYLIPADETRGGVPEVVTFSNVGPGCPEPAWHGRWHCLGSLPVEFCADSLVEVLESQRDKLQQIADAYLGSEWDGHNHRGRWEEDVDDITIDLECETYWDAGDWLGSDQPQTDRDILAADSLESLAEGIVDNAAGTARLQLGDVLDCLTGRAGDLLNENREELTGLVYAYEDEACDLADGRVVQLRGDWYVSERCADDEYRIAAGQRLTEAEVAALLTACTDEEIADCARSIVKLSALIDC